MVGPLTKKLTLLIAPLMMVGCGSGSSSSDSINGTVATVIVEERLGKTVLDAWFEQGSATTFNVATQSSQNVDTCVVNPQPTRRGAPLLVNEDTGLHLANRTGTFVSLAPNRLSSDTVYATDARWLSAPVSDDASLVFDSSSQFQSIGVVTLPTLAPLKWVAPTDGALNAVSDNLQWVPSTNANTTVKINVSVTHPSSISGDSTVVVCHVADDGQFQLDGATQQRLNAIGGSVLIRAQRLRVQTYQSGDAHLNVVQISHERAA